MQIVFILLNNNAGHVSNKKFVFFIKTISKINEYAYERELAKQNDSETFDCQGKENDSIMLQQKVQSIMVLNMLV